MFRGLLFFKRSSTMGTDPTAAALWIAYWPLLSLARAVAGGLLSSNRRATSRLFFDAVKCNAVYAHQIRKDEGFFCNPTWPLKPRGNSELGTTATKGRLPFTFVVDICSFSKKKVHQLVSIFQAHRNHQWRPSRTILNESEPLARTDISTRKPT